MSDRHYWLFMAHHQLKITACSSLTKQVERSGKILPCIAIASIQHSRNECSVKCCSSSSCNHHISNLRQTLILFTLLDN